MNKKYIMTEEHKRKISEANKGKTGEIDTLTEKIRREKIKRTMKQKYLDDPLSFKRITECSLKKKEKLGYVNSPEARKKVSASLSKMWQDNKVTNKQKGTLFKKGYDPKRNVSKIFNEGHKSYAYKGMNKGLFALEKHPNWLGGKSFEPYGVEFNRVLKEKMRKKYSYRCQQCFRHQEELRRKLCIHHIDFDKKNNNEDNLIPLCENCHAQTNYNRDDWTKYFNGRLNGDF